MSLQRIPHDATKYRNNPVELLNISNRNRIGSEYSLSSNTKLLITGTGENNSTNIVDSTGKAITRAGDTKISTAQSIIGGSSIYFDGTGDYLSLADSDDWYFGSGDFTVDFWVNPSSVGQSLNSLLVEQANNATEYSPFVLMLANGTYNFMYNISYNGSAWQVTGQVFGTGAQNTWSHLALVRSGANIYLFAAGTLGHTYNIGASSFFNAASPILIGGGNYVTTYLNGYLSHFRITKGQALWTGNFTPPKYISNNYIGA